ncbi:SpoIIE family protein phosphatase [Nocardioides sp. KIGAM211]|uniref:SpoIIE family protein phosphatase n=1 Tax=Nocardioides luti TaxID=2761101 RepID=A0A7X0RJ40_9ACTN|nr:SpoIIE family protein phosphatase [Nocardioides luti]
MSDLFRHAGTLRADYDAVDWSATTLGPVDGWAPELRSAVDLMLNSRFPITLLWGRDLVLVYNEAYTELIGDKHPAALGARTEDVFPEAWDVIGPMLHGVLDGEGPTWVESAPLPLERKGFLEECFFTFAYSPVHDASGAVTGIIDISTETTSQVIVARRLQLLTRLAAELAAVEHVDDVPRRAVEVLRSVPDDLPAVDVRLRGLPLASTGLPLRPRHGLSISDTLVEETEEGRIAWVPLTPSEPVVGRSLLVARLSDRLAPDQGYLDFLVLVAASITQAMDRVAAREAERTLSEALQRSLLTQPPGAGDLVVAVRYQPAAELAQVGGDWYDAFLLPDGSLTMVVGDVAGHDQDAAASMGQLRNLVRGVAYSLQETPSRVLSGLDHAMDGLAVDVVATAVLAQLAPAVAGQDGLTLSWSNAGHPPPVLLAADGSARLLETTPDLLLGLQADTSRSDHTLALAPGDSLVIYTDGLVERRGVPLQESLDWLLGVLEGRQSLPPEELCNHLLGQLDGRGEDDVALLVVRSAAA